MVGKAIPKRRPVDWWWALSTALLVCALLVFAWANFRQWWITGRPIGLGLMTQESVAAALLVFRRRTERAARTPVVWLATTIGTFGMLAARPTDAPVGGQEPAWIGLQLVGVGVAVFSLWSLGRSFGLVAANRGVQTGGAYRFVRHPVYAAYSITYLGYLLENPSLRNAAVVLAVWSFQLLRIRQEEGLLSADPAYQAYRARVRYRLVPFLY